MQTLCLRTAFTSSNTCPVFLWPLDLTLSACWVETEAGVGQTDIFKEGLLPCAMGLGDTAGQALESLRCDPEGSSISPELWPCSGLEALAQIQGDNRAGISEVAM